MAKRKSFRSLPRRAQNAAFGRMRKAGKVYGNKKQKPSFSVRKNRAETTAYHSYRKALENFRNSKNIGVRGAGKKKAAITLQRTVSRMAKIGAMKG